jgi:hypothetical protein
MVQNRSNAVAGMRTPPLRQIPLEQGRDEVPAPCHAVRLRCGQKRVRERATPPQDSRRTRTRLGKIEAADLDPLDPPGKALGTLAQQIPRRAPQNQKPGGMTPAVGQHPQQRKQSRPSLHFVDHHQPAQRLECRLRLIKPRQARRILKIEVIRRFLRQKPARQRGFPSLTRPGEHHHRTPVQSHPDFLGQTGTQHHGRQIP